MKKTALLIGNSSGIGEEVTKRLLAKNYELIGISRSDSLIEDPSYRHITLDVSSREFKSSLYNILGDTTKIDLCIHFAGIGGLLELDKLEHETKVFEVNLMSAVITTEVILKRMLEQGYGHIIGLSSVADSLVSEDSPSYSASKSGISKYWEGLGLRVKKVGINISNIRFGFVDTKMAKAPVRPFLLSVKQAADTIEKVIEKPKIRVTRPLQITPLILLIRIIVKIKIIFS